MIARFAGIDRKALTLHATGTAVFIVLGLVCWSAIVTPAANRREARAELARRERAGLSEVDRQVRLRQRLSAQLAASNELFLRSGVKLRSAGELNERLAAIADLAGRCGVRIDSINPSGVKSGQLLEVHPLQLSGHGSYPTAYAFMRDLRVAMPDMSVARFTLTAEAGEGQTTASFSMTIDWCAQIEPPANASVH